MQQTGKIDYFALKEATAAQFEKEATKGSLTESATLLEQERQEKTRNQHISTISRCFAMLFSCSVVFSFTMLISIPVLNNIASPVRSFIVLPSFYNTSSPTLSNSTFSAPTLINSTSPLSPFSTCAIWKYQAGYWPPLGWSSVVGDCYCFRGYGCRCYIQGCGDYAAYNYWYNVASWASYLLFASSILGAVSSLAVFLTVTCDRKPES